MRDLIWAAVDLALRYYPPMFLLGIVLLAYS
jgi:hypothetical protein